MIPHIVHIGGIPLNSFGLCVALALFAGILSVQRSLARYGCNPAHAEGMVFIAGVSGIVGARALYLIEIFDGFTPFFWDAVFASAGFTFYGGFLVASVAVAVYVWKRKIPLQIAAAVAAPAVALGYAIGRLGCQLSGDGDYGKATTSIFGMAYDTGVIPTPAGILAYPTPLYESVICLGIAAVLLHLETLSSWRAKPLAIFCLGVLLLAIERFLIEFLRINPLIAYGFSGAQLIALVLSLCCGATLFWTRFRAAE